MIKGVRDFYYNVADMKRAVSFYSEALGMHQVYGDEYWTTMQIGPLHMGLHWTEGSVVPPTSRDAHGQNCGGTLTLHSDNISEDRERITRCGGKILGEGIHPWGHMLVFEDLDGNVLKLMKDPEDK
jgi:predicted enzyme related to lactoylglutathione lyase